MTVLGWLLIGAGVLLIGVAVAFRLCSLATRHVKQPAPREGGRR